MSTETPTDDLAVRLHLLRISADGARHTPQAFNMDVLMGDFGRALGALEKVLELHAVTGYHWHLEPCAKHGRGVPSDVARECPDCRVIEYAACETCRDDEGNPARPEDCKVRQVISLRMLGDHPDGVRG